MKITRVLFGQNIGRQIKQNWWVKSKLKILPNEAEDLLKSKNIRVYEPADILNEKIIPEKVEIVGIKPEPVKFDRTHPHWNDRVCLMLRDENVLLEGLMQAKIITNTVEVKEGLPEKVDVSQSIKGINNRVKEIIFSSHVFDAEQKKLSKIKDPLRPAWNFPRTFGISENRRNTLIISKLLHLLEVHVEPQIVKDRSIFNDLYFSYNFEKNEDLIQFELRGDTLLTSSQPLNYIYKEDTTSMQIPNIDPIKETVTLNKEHIYKIRNCYPIDLTIRKCHPHTLFVQYDGTEVKNIYEEEVTDAQVHGRSLLKSFTVAASYARQLYGDNVRELPKPVTLQCVQTDGRLFHFGIFQLNTLDLSNSAGIKNIWYQTERLPLFETCAYVLGKPTLEGYNDMVLKYLLAFYNNV